MPGANIRSREGQSRLGLWIEYLFILLILAGLVNAAIFFFKFGFLPQPYFYEPNGTFTDWFAIAYWAHHPGAYDIERSIYPPISFLVMRLFSNSACYQEQGLEARYCDTSGIATICAMYVLAVIVVFWTCFRVDRRTALPRGVALGFGLPLTYAFERGNFIMLCLVCTLLAYGPVLRSARLRWLFVGMAVNFKVYVIAAVLAPLLRRRWTAVEGMLIATVLVYLVTWYLFGTGDPRVIYANVRDFGNSYSAGNPNDLWYPSSYQPLMAALNGYTLPVLSFLGSRTVENMLWGVHLYVRFSQIAVLAAVAATWIRPEVVPPYRVLTFAIGLALMTSEVGGYTQILLLPFVFMESWRGWGRPAVLLLAYLMCIPMEYVFASLPSGIIRDSFLSGRYVTVYYGLGLGSLLRPAVLALITTIRAAVTIRDVWMDVRHHGWRDRWRFRRDWPIFPGIARPQPPVVDAATPERAAP